MTQQQTVHVPLLALSISPRNVRRTKPARIDELAALIKSQGLLQNLVVVEAKPTKGVDQVGYGVVGGGRRLRALQLLSRQGDIAEDFPVPCYVVPDAQAEEASVAENSGREAMHPADEFDAFKRMHDAGSSVEDIAARFGVVPAVVTRRLKLANVAPKLLDVYRAGGMTLEQVMALAITDDHKLQVKAWGKDDENRWYREPHSLKSKLTTGMVATRDNANAQFVGIEAYEAAGGVVVRDLFDQSGGGYLADQDLLDRLYAEKLEAEAEKLRAEGWAFVVVQHEGGYLNVYKYGRSKATVRELTAEERAEIDQINSKIDELVAESERLEQAGDYELSEAKDDQVETLEAQRDAIQARLQTYTDRQKKKAGAMVGVTRNGLEIARGLVEPAAAKPGSASGSEPVARPVHSESLMNRLSAHRTASLAAHLLEAPRVALDLLCTTMAVKVIYENQWPNLGLQVSPTSQLHYLRAAADDIEGSKAWGEIHVRLDEYRQAMPTDQRELFKWIGKQLLADVVDILAYCTAVSMNAVTGVETARPMDELQETLGLDMADWWQPTQAGYFKHIKKDHVLDAIADAGGKDALADLAKLKKGQLDAHAEEMLKDTGWIPTVLRTAKAKED